MVYKYPFSQVLLVSSHFKTPPLFFTILPSRQCIFFHPPNIRSNPTVESHILYSWISLNLHSDPTVEPTPFILINISPDKNGESSFNSRDGGSASGPHPTWVYPGWKSCSQLIWLGNARDTGEVDILIDPGISLIPTTNRIIIAESNMWYKPGGIFNINIDVLKDVVEENYQTL